VISRDVIFDETFMLKQNEAEVFENNPMEKSTVEVEFDEDNLPSDKDNEEDDSQQQQHEEPYSIARGREKRVHKAPQRYGFEDMVSFALFTSSGDPLSYRDATNKKHNDKWLVAMSKEMESLQKKKIGNQQNFPKKEGYWLQVGIPQERNIFRKQM
jgi:hypothetical protein